MSNLRTPAAVVAMSLAALACGEGDLVVKPADGPARPFVDPPRDLPELGETEKIVPGSGMPAEYVQENGISNNNLEVTRHDGRVYLAIRNGKFHFASPDTRLYVFSSADQKTWDFETKISVAHDVREPRFLSYKGRLFLYFANLGDNRFDFRPYGMSYVERLGQGKWSQPAGFYRPGEPYIPWRVRVVRGKPYMLAYRNGEHEYDFSGQPMDIELLTTADGLDWVPVDPSNRVVSRGGGSETDFALDEGGDLYAVIRNEAGDSTGWGSKICFADRHALGKWTCRHDRKKYDSPYVFSHDGQIFLFGRRNVTDTGYFQLEEDGVPWSPGEAFSNLTKYSLAPKRCSLWQVDRVTLEVRFMLDLPSKGDTCFVSMIEDTRDPLRSFFVYNYSSPIDEPGDPPWSVGQLGQTNVYRTWMRFR